MLNSHPMLSRIDSVIPAATPSLIRCPPVLGNRGKRVSSRATCDSQLQSSRTSHPSYGRQSARSPHCHRSCHFIGFQDTYVVLTDYPQGALSSLPEADAYLFGSPAYRMELEWYDEASHGTQDYWGAFGGGYQYAPYSFFYEADHAQYFAAYVSFERELGDFVPGDYSCMLASFLHSDTARFEAIGMGWYHYHCWVTGLAANFSVQAPIQATVDIKPDALNMTSRGRWITAYIELPEGYEVADIDVESLQLNGDAEVADESPSEVGDYDHDGIADLMVKFDRDEVQVTGDVGESVTLELTGEIDERELVGSDTVRIISRELARQRGISYTAERRRTRSR